MTHQHAVGTPWAAASQSSVYGDVGLSSKFNEDQASIFRRLVEQAKLTLIKPHPGAAVLADVNCYVGNINRREYVAAGRTIH